MKRRELIKGLAVLPLAGNIINAEAAQPDADELLNLRSFGEGFTAPKGPLVAGPRIYESIGVEPIINCRGTFSIIGGSIERKEVREAMEFASRQFVQYDELAFGVGTRLAEITGAEWGIVSSGCAGILKLVTIACVTGGDPEKLHMIPDVSKLEKNEVIIPRGSQSAYDFSIQNVGVKIIRVDTPEEFEKALSSRTAMIKLSGGSLTPGPMGLDSIAKMAKPWKVPILADAAAEILTIPNVHLKAGADIVAYSGGKVLCGPQCAGFAFGRKDILMSAWQASAPHHGAGRDNKVGREEMLGMLAAVEAWIARDHDADWKAWLAGLKRIADTLSPIASVQTNISEPTGLGNRSPRLSVTWDPGALNITGEEVSELLISTKPRITLGAERNADAGRTGVGITAFQMQPGEFKIVGDRLFEVLSEKRAPKTVVPVQAASADMSGLWDVAVEFYSGKGNHTWLLQQDGNVLRGTHKTDLSIREITGFIEADQVRIQSPAPRPSASFIFWGKVNGDTMSGKINMGEFLDATFTATRRKGAETPPDFKIPSGHIMSS